MEFHKQPKATKRPDIITKKRINPQAHIFSSYSHSNYPTTSQFFLGRTNLTEKNLKQIQTIDFRNENPSLIENVKQKINRKLDTNDLIYNIPPTSLAINLQPKYQIKRPIKKYSTQIKNPNPLKQIEYQQIQSMNSSQGSIPNSLLINFKTNSKTNSQEKNSNSSIGISPIYLNRSANINKNNNEMEIEINSSEEKSPKIRYHRPRKINNPLYNYNNAENEELIYNVPLTDEDSIGKNNFNYNKYFDAYEINDGVDPFQIRVVRKSNNKKENVINGNPFFYSSDEALENSTKFEEKKKNIRITKKLNRNYTEIYDPKKNKKGILLPKTKMTVPLIEGSLFEDKQRNFSKSSKLSDIILTKKKYSPDPMSLGYEDYFSGSEDKTTCQNETKVRNLKTFNRRSFEKYTKNQKSLKVHKSPEERFKNFSLAMICSKGKNTENRPILRKMRFEKGGVVDLAQDDGKKNKMRFFIKKIKSPGKQLIHNNPKYREKAAELIKEWWFAIKEFKKKKIQSAILIQSCFRGRFTRKYLYDVIYMHYLYFGFCKKIEKFIRKKYGPIFFDSLFSRFIKKKKFLKKIVLNYQKNLIKLYLDKWKMNTKNENRKKLALLYLLRIRATRESKMFNLRRLFSKWHYIAIIQKERSDIKDLQKSQNKNIEIDSNLKDKKDFNIDTDKIKNDNMIKIKGLLNIINGANKYIKKKVVEIVNPKIKKYMNGTIKINKLEKLVIIRKKTELIIIKKYFYIYYNNCFDKEIKDKKIKKKIFHKYDSYSDNDFNDINEKLQKMIKEIDKLKKLKLELFIKKIEPYLSSKKCLLNLLLNWILNKMGKFENILEKYEKKLKKKEKRKKTGESPIEEEQTYQKYKYKQIKKIIKEDNDTITSSEEEKVKTNKKRDNISSKAQKEQKPNKKYDKKINYCKEEKEEEESEDKENIVRPT